MNRGTMVPRCLLPVIVAFAAVSASIEVRQIMFHTLSVLQKTCLHMRRPAAKTFLAVAATMQTLAGAREQRPRLW